MAREIKLNSTDWCDLIFAGKNKAYGAYKLRQSSSKRHAVALGIVTLFVGAVTALPAFLDAVKSADNHLGGIDEVFTLTDVQMEEPENEADIIRQEIVPPTPPTRAAVRFTPPAIVEDANVNEEREMRSMEELNENRDLQISIVDNLEGSTDANALAPETLVERRKIVEEEPQTPFKHVEQMPMYPGGDAELMRFINGNIKYPAIAAENNIEGMVVLRFVVGKDGKVSDITTIRSLDPSCDKEALRVVKLMSKWVPGMQNGRPVPVYYTLPIRFKLQR